MCAASAALSLSTNVKYTRPHPPLATATTNHPSINHHSNPAL
jgi:hypothetical protein